MIYEYIIPDCGDIYPDDVKSFKIKQKNPDFKILCEAAAKNFYNSHDGYEIDDWPLTFGIYKNKKLIGYGSVYMEIWPVFVGYE